jgi:opine dehydrogenase
MAALARLAGVATPTMDALIDLASEMLGVRYRETGLSLDRLGLGGVRAADLARFVHEGA